MKSKNIRINYPLFKIVADGGVSDPEIGEARFIPSLIIDVQEHEEITDLIKLHYENATPGDTELFWTFPKSFFKPKSIYLNIKFIRPMELAFGIEFNLSTQYSLVDGIIQSRGFYIQTGKDGDKVSELKNKVILIEVPNLGVDASWNQLVTEIIENEYRKEGLTKKERKFATKEHMKKMRELWHFRIT